MSTKIGMRENIQDNPTANPAPGAMHTSPGNKPQRPPQTADGPCTHPIDIRRGPLPRRNRPTGGSRTDRRIHSAWAPTNSKGTIRG